MSHICEGAHKCEANTDPVSPAVDILVIGGGVNGLAVAREAAVRGWTALVVEAEDVGAGTSGTSSRLVHGGVRYLENLEFHLVRESLKERERLLHTAPHLVKPYPLLIPFYRHNGRHGVILRLGMLLYDLLSFDKTTPRHRTFSKAKVAAAYPGLETDGLYGAALYYDAQAANTERLCVEQAIDITALGGSVRTHTRVTGLSTDDGHIAVEMTDELTGRTMRQVAGLVVNAAGPWVDQVLELAPGSTPRLIGGTKGSHFTVGPFAGAPSTGIHFEATSDGRAILVLPLPDGNVLIGATDIFFEGDPGSAEMSDDEVDYLLAEVNRLIPQAGLQRSDVLHSISGVRPLPYTPSAKTAAQVSRSHHLVPHSTMSNVYSVTGGKLTTHRALGEMVIDKLQPRRRGVGESLGRGLRSLLSIRPTSTRQLKLPGARIADWKRFESSYRHTSSFPAPVTARILGLYGVRVSALEQLAAARPALAEVLPGRGNVIAAEVVLAIREEFARSLIDIVGRRLLLGWADDAGLDSIESIASIAAEELAWDEDRVHAELDAYRNWILRRRPARLEESGLSRPSGAQIH